MWSSVIRWNILISCLANSSYGKGGMWSFLVFSICPCFFLLHFPDPPIWPPTCHEFFLFSSRRLVHVLSHLTPQHGSRARLLNPAYSNRQPLHALILKLMKLSFHLSWVYENSTKYHSVHDYSTLLTEGYCSWIVYSIAFNKWLFSADLSSPAAIYLADI